MALTGNDSPRCSRWRKIGSACLAAAFGAQAIEWLYWFVTGPRLNRFDIYDYGLAGDSPVFQAAARILRDTPERLYDPASLATALAAVPGSPVFGPNTVYRYPPSTATAFLPLADASQLAGWAVVSLFSVLLVGLGLRLLGVSWRWVALVPLFVPVVLGLRLGQLALVATGCLALAAVAQQRRRPLLAGVAIGILVIKPQYALGIVLFWLLEPRGHYRQLLGLAASALGILAVSWLSGPAAWWAFVEALGTVVSHRADPGWLVHQFSVAGSISLLAGPSAARLAALSSLALFLLGWPRVTRELDERTKYALAIVAGLLVSPFVVDYDWTLLLVPAALLWIDHAAARSKLVAVFGIVALAALISRAIAVGSYFAFPYGHSLQLAPWVLLVAFALLRRIIGPPAPLGGSPGAPRSQISTIATR